VVGTRLEAKCSGWRRYYPGMITRVNLSPSDTYKVVFDDGDVREAVTRAEMQFVVEQTQTAPPRSGSSRAPFRVPARSGSATGSSNSPTSSSSRGAGEESSTSGGEVLLVGTRVQGRFMGQSKFYTGTIDRLHPDGTYDIRYDDGDHETHVARHLIKRLVPASSYTRGGLLIFFFFFFFFVVINHY
jgi:hypothetical protein